MLSYLYKDLYKLEETHWWHISKRRIIKDLLKRNLGQKNQTILDVGCGAGKNLEELKEFGSVWGLDNSQDALKYCKKRGLTNVQLGTAEATPFPALSFNTITLLDVLEHTDDKSTLKEMYRILKKNGLVIITVPAFSWLWSDWDKVLQHKRRYNKNILLKILRENNFTIIYATYLYSFLVLPAMIIRQIKQRFLKKGVYSSDFKLSNNLINKIMSTISKIEYKISKIIPIPLGTTILVVAKK